MYNNLSRIAKQTKTVKYNLGQIKNFEKLRLVLITFIFI